MNYITAEELYQYTLVLLAFGTFLLAVWKTKRK